MDTETGQVETFFLRRRPARAPKVFASDFFNSIDPFLKLGESAFCSLMSGLRQLQLLAVICPTAFGRSSRKIGHNASDLGGPCISLSRRHAERSKTVAPP